MNPDELTAITNKLVNLSERAIYRIHREATQMIRLLFIYLFVFVIFFSYLHFLEVAFERV